MSYWAEDPELFLHKGKDGVVHVLRCNKETMTSSSSSMLMKPEDFTDEGAVTDLRRLTGSSCEWKKNKYDALIDYIYPRNLLVNCHGSLIVEIEPDEKSVLALLLKLLFLLLHWLLVNLFHKNKKAAVVYMRALDIIDMGCYGPGSDHLCRAVPVRAVKYLQDGMIVKTEPTPKERKLIKEVETLQHELVQAYETIEVDSVKIMELQKEVKALELELSLAKEKIKVESEIDRELSRELTIESTEVKTLQTELEQAKKEIGEEKYEVKQLTDELAAKGKEVESLQQQLAKEATEIEGLIKKVATLELDLKFLVPLPLLRIHTKSNMDCSLTIRNGHEAILGRNVPMDDCQYWVKDSRYGDKCYPEYHMSVHCYALVNKSTGEALKPGAAPYEQLKTVPYDQSVIDRSILWMEDEHSRDDYIAIKKAFDSDSYLGANGNQGPIGDGTTIGVWKWLDGDNQKWCINTISP